MNKHLSDCRFPKYIGSKRDLLVDSDSKTPSIKSHFNRNASLTWLMPVDTLSHRCDANTTEPHQILPYNLCPSDWVSDTSPGFGFNQPVSLHFLEKRNNPFVSQKSLIYHEGIIPDMRTALCTADSPDDERAAKP